MVQELLMVGAFAVVVLFLWRIVAILTLAVNNQVEWATSILGELERIRAGLFAVTRIKEGEGWPEFEELTRYIVRDYIAPKRFESREGIP
ncbi:MAG: hypothetical protein ABSA41_00595 [Terriglobia bacterium]|jgi:hypothetical protein